MAFRSVATATAVEAGSVVIPKPAGVVQDDLLVAELDCVTDAPALTVTPPAGWTQIRQDGDGGEPIHTGTVFWKAAGAAEPADYTFTFSAASDCAGAISAYTGRDTAAPIDSHGGQANASSLSVTAPSINVVDIGSVDLLFCGSIKSLSTFTPPTGMTERFDLNVSGGLSPIAGEGADEVFTGGGATGTRVATATVAATNIGQLVALKPAAAGQQFTQAVAGVLSFAGALLTETGKVLSGALSFAGALLRETRRALVGGLTFTGALTLQTTRTLAGALSFVGTLATAIIFTQTLAGVLSFAGDLVAEARKALAGGLTWVGALARETRRALAGGLSFVGSTVPRAGKAVAGVLSFVGDLATSLVFLRDVAGVLSFAGALVAQGRKALSGALSFAGALARQTRTTLAGALSFTGTLVREFQSTVAGTLSFLGDVATTRVFLRSVAGSLSFAGALEREARKLLAGALSFAGAVIPRPGKALLGSLTWSGALAPQAQLVLAAGLTFGGALGLGQFVSVAGGLSFAGALGTVFTPGGPPSVAPEDETSGWLYVLHDWRQR